MNKYFVVFISSLSALFYAESREIYNAPSVSINPGIIAVDTLPGTFNSIDYHLRIEIPRNCSYASWETILTYDDNSTTIIIAERDGISFDDVLYGLPLKVRVRSYNSKGSLTKFSDYDIIKDIDPVCDGWSMTITLNSDDTQAIFSIGQKSNLLSFPIECKNLKTISSSSDSNLRLARLSLFVNETESLESSFINSYDHLRSILTQSNNTAEGLWRYLDRDTDLRRLNLGGSYMLATVSAPDGSIEILYLGQAGGSSSNSKRWKPLMLKGRLIPTIFMNHYDLEWFDAFGSKISYETSADIIDGAILKLNFPMQGGTVRFQKATMAPDDRIR